MDSNQSDNKYFCNRCKDKNFLIECECGTCEDIITRYHRNGTYRKYAFNHHFRLEKNKRNQFGANNSKWSGGEYFHRKEGYWYVKDWNHPNRTKDGYVRKHVKIFTDYYRCCMLKWGVVDHINQIKTDNDIENLRGMMQRRHLSHHHKNKKGRKLNFGGRICLLCGSKTTYINKNDGYEVWYKYKNGFVCMSCYGKNKPLPN